MNWNKYGQKIPPSRMCDTLHGLWQVSCIHKVRIHVVNYNIKQVNIYRLKQRMQTQKETVLPLPIKTTSLFEKYELDIDVIT